MQLLNSVGVFPDSIIATNVDESVLTNELPKSYVARIALKKNKAVRSKEGQFVLSADTTVAVGRRILGKPADKFEAESFLNLLSGRRHRVITTVCISFKGRYYSKTVTTFLKMKRLSTMEKKSHLSSCAWKGFSGGYAIQGKASYLFPFISGSYTNVVGLPLTETLAMLSGLGYKIHEKHNQKAE